MTTCGMYDFAGEWLVSVGHAGEERRLRRRARRAAGPARHRRLLAAARRARQQRPRRRASAATSRTISPLHLVRPGERPAPPVRAVYYARRARVEARPHAGAARRAARGRVARTAVFELQGELGFAPARRLARRVEAPATRPSWSWSTCAASSAPTPAGARFSPRSPSASRRAAARSRSPARASRPRPRSGPCPGGAATFADLDLALEWCEDELLARAGEQPAADGRADRRSRAARRARRPAELGAWSSSSARSSRRPATLLVRQGEPAARRSSSSPAARSACVRGRRRTGAACASRRSRPAGRSASSRSWIAASARPTCARIPRSRARTLRYAAIDALAASDPALHGKLLRNLLGVVSATLHGVNAEIAHLTR